LTKINSDLTGEAKKKSDKKKKKKKKKKNKAIVHIRKRRKEDKQMNQATKTSTTQKLYNNFPALSLMASFSDAYI